MCPTSSVDSTCLSPHRMERMVREGEEGGEGAQARGGWRRKEGGRRVDEVGIGEGGR